jgi:hypothetical protein
MIGRIEGDVCDEAVYTKGTRTLTLKGNVSATLPEGIAVAAK